MTTSGQKIDNIRRKMSELENVKIPTAEFSKLQNELKNVKKEYDKLYSSLSSFGFKEVEGMRRVDPVFDNVARRIEELESEIEVLNQTGKAFTLGTDTDEFANLSAHLQEEQSRLSDLEQRYQKYNNIIERTNSIKENATISDQRLVDLLEEQKALQEEINLLKQAGLTAGYKEYDEAAAQLASVNSQIAKHIAYAPLLQAVIQGLKGDFSGMGVIAKKVFSSMTGAAKKMASTIVDASKKVVLGFGSIIAKGTKLLLLLPRLGLAGISALSGIGKHSKSAGNMVTRFGSRVLGLAKRVFVFSLITKGFRAMLSGIQEGFSTYISYDTQLKTSINNLKASLSGLKASLGAAFAPIVSAVVPYLQTMINWLITAINAVGAFIAALTGSSTYKKASVNIASVGDAASGAADDLGSAADEAERLENAVASYDELNLIDIKDDSDSGGSGGSGGDSGTSSGGDITYTDEEIGDSIKDFAERLREAWEQADFTEIGNIVGEKIRDALNSIDWTGIQEISAKVGKSIATFINGAVETSGLADALGRTLGELINTAISNIEAFATNLHWDSVGTFIADSLNSALDIIDWGKIFTAADAIGTGLADALNAVINTTTFQKVGKTLGNVLNTVVSGAKSFLTEANFAEWGNAVAEGMNSFMETVSWSELGETIRLGINGIFKLAKTWSESFDFKLLGESIKTAINSTLNGISWQDAITAASNIGKGIATTLNEAITPETFKNLGKTVAGAVNTVVAGAYEFIGTVDWNGWGTSLASGINKFFGDVDWKKIGLTFSGAVKGIIDTLASAVKGTSWYDVGDSIADMIKGIEWMSLLSSVGDLLLAAIKAALQTALGLADGLFSGIDWGIDTSTIDFSNWQTGVEKLRESIYATNDEIHKMIDSSSDWKTAGDEDAELAKSMADEYFKLSEKQSLSNDERERMKTLASELVEQYPELKDYYDSETGLLNTTKEAVNNLIEAHLREVKVAVAKEEVTDAYKAVLTATQNAKDATDAYNQSVMKVSQLEIERGQLSKQASDELEKYGSVSTELTDKMQRLDLELESANDEVRQNKEAMDAAKQAQDDANKSYQETIDFLRDVTSGTDDYSEALKNLPKNIKVIIEKKGLDATLDEKIKVVAEVTGMDTSGMTDKEIEDCYAEIVEAYGKSGLSVDSDVNAKKITNKFGENVEADVDAKDITNTSGKTVDAEVTTKKITNKFGENVEADVSAQRITNKFGENFKVDADANMVKATDSLSKKDKTVDTTTRFAHVKNDLTDKQKTFAVTTRYAHTKNDLTENQKTIATKARYVSTTDNLNQSQKTLGTTARFYSVQDNLSSSQRTLNTTARIIGQANVPTIRVTASFTQGGHAVMAKGGVYSGGIWHSLPQFAGGGIIDAARGIIQSITRFASGGLPDHGTMFVAGEAGPEVVGDVNGRTEILNKSQIASAIYSAVLAALSNFSVYVDAINKQQVTCADYIANTFTNTLAQLQTTQAGIYATAYNLPNIGSYSVTTDVNRINAIRDGINASGAINSNNTAWMDALAEKLNGGNITIENIIRLDGREIYKNMVQQDRKTYNMTGHSGFAF